MTIEDSSGSTVDVGRADCITLLNRALDEMVSMGLGSDAQTEDTNSLAGQLEGDRVSVTDPTCIWVLADKPIADSLAKIRPIVKIDESKSFAPKSDESLIVYAHTLLTDNSKRARHEGLLWLRDQLSRHDFPPELPIAVIGLIDEKDYRNLAYIVNDDSMIYRQLPLSLDTEIQPDVQHSLVESMDFERLCLELESHKVDLKQRMALALRSSEELLELDFATERHKFKSLAAAVRIYFGMLAAGHADRNNAWRILDAMMLRARDARIVVTLSADELVGRIKSHRNLVKVAKQMKCRTGHHSLPQPALSIWLVDDQAEHHLWDEVLPIMCKKDKYDKKQYESFASWDELKGALYAGVDPETVLLVDCNLNLRESSTDIDDDQPIGSKDTDHITDSCDNSTGLELLASIRSIAPDIRVVFFSSYDDAQLALTAMRAGATAYFVKELTDPTDRSSIRYYDQLLSTCRQSADSIEIAKAWKSYQSMLSPAGLQSRNPDLPLSGQPEEEKLPLPSTLKAQMDLAFYMAFAEADGMHWSTWGGGRSGLGSQFDASPIIAVLIAGWAEKKVYDPRKGYEVWKSVGPASWKECVNIVKSIRHPDPSRRTTLTDARVVIKAITDRLEPQKASYTVVDPVMPAFSPYRREDLQVDSPYPGISIQDIKLSHEDADPRAAQELARGWLCNAECGCSASDSVEKILEAHHASASIKGNYSDILVIDDHGESNQWFTLLRKMFPKIHTVEDPRELENVVLAEKSLILLDLKMGDTSTGLKLLKRIKQWHSSVPVLVVSAATEELNAIRCLKAGAVDYVSKSLPYIRYEHEQRRKFYIEFASKVELARRLGASNVRHYWRRIDELRHLKKWGNARIQQENWRHIQTQIDLEWEKEINLREGRVDTYHPPDPSCWAGMIADQLAVLVMIYQLAWTPRQTYKIRDEQEPLQDGDSEVTSMARLVALDDWRVGVLVGKDSEAAARLVALLAGGIIDLLARWYWCWEKQQKLIVVMWGGPYANLKIWIEDQVSLLDKGFEVWEKRNEALYKNRPQPNWAQWKLIDEMINDTFTAVASFRDKMNWQE